MEYSKTLTLTDDSDLQLPIELWERHFTADPEPRMAIVQPVGPAVAVWIWSPRDLIEVRIPTVEWLADKPYRRSLNGKRLDVSRWHDTIDTDDDGEMNAVRATVRPYSPEWIPTVPA